ncbi:corticotropin-releasing factor receptor 2-like [Tubulanus polymorphus]|uniref:corticotropin-releasing factor receptor 2-like n=1 Tax=Tubulanus polymorphus TaxID=672921 RepID=UPI003DA67E36
MCWPTAPGNTTISQSCPPKLFPKISKSVKATKACAADGRWGLNGWTNYTDCIRAAMPTVTTVFLPPPDGTLLGVLTFIYYIGCSISLLMLAITMFIFCYFKSLHCSRITIHQHLVMSFIIRFTLTIITMTVHMNSSQYIIGITWLCRGVFTLYYYSIAANMFWMFVEGLFLHTRVAVSVFNSEIPFFVFYIIGWGLPGVVTICWAVVTHFTSNKPCWEESTKSPFFLIIVVPIGVVLAVNCIFMFNIIRILITKLRASNTFETAQVRKAAKAMIVLFPLLGITQLLMFLGPSSTTSNKTLYKAYLICNALLQPSQGIFVALIYCFLNAEVKAAVNRWWQRHRLRQLGGTRNRRRSSRTSSLFLSQTEVLFMVAIRRNVFKRRQSDLSADGASISAISEATVEAPAAVARGAAQQTTETTVCNTTDLHDIPEEPCSPMITTPPISRGHNKEVAKTAETKHIISSPMTSLVEATDV